MCVSGYKIIEYYGEVYKNNKMSKEMEQIFINEKKQSQNPIEKLKKENEDTVGWLTIHDTNISYPVVQGTDNSYYLSHTFNRESSMIGSLFMDYRNDLTKEFQNIIIYGHNRKDGSMFHNLRYFVKDSSYINKKKATFFDEQGEYTGEVVSAYVVDKEDSYTTPSFSTQEEYDAYLSKVIARSKFDFKSKTLKHDKLLTLSTCTVNLDDNRVVVHILLNKTAEE